MSANGGKTGRSVPVIALTAAALTSERDEALASGMNDFLTKPIDARRLHETLVSTIFRNPWRRPGTSPRCRHRRAS